MWNFFFDKGLFQLIGEKKLLIYSLEEQVVEIKNISESFWKFTFGQDDHHNWDFASPNSKPYTSNFPGLEITFIFNNKS